MANEDFTTYTEVDAATYLDIPDAVTIDYTAVPRNADNWVYFDYGADSLKDFNLKFKHVKSAADSSAISSTGMTDGLIARNNAADPSWWIFWTRLSGVKFRLGCNDGGTSDFDSSLAIGNVGTAYIEVDKVGTSFTCYIRTGSHTGTLEDTLSITSDYNMDFRYMMAAWFDRSGGTAKTTGSIEDMTLELTEAAVAQVLINTLKSALFGEVIIK